ncbi:MAG TPA: YceI family protein [Roseovarius sp.]
MRFLPLAALTFAASSVHAAPEKFALDPDHTVVAFTVDHVGYARVLGIFGEVSGSFVYDTETQVLSDVNVTIGSASVDTFHDARDGHVKDRDFLNSDAFPEITFTAAGGTPTAANAGRVTGDLTLLGKTRPVTLNVTLNKAEPYPFGHGRFVLGLSITAEIARSEWGMSYAVENGLVGDTVGVMIETEAMRMD